MILFSYNENNIKVANQYIYEDRALAKINGRINRILTHGSVNNKDELRNFYKNRKIIK